MKQRKPRPKEIADKRHFKARLHERYQIQIDDERYKQILRAIQGKRVVGITARYVREESNTRSVWLVDLPEREGIVVVYSSVPGKNGHKSLVTALQPPRRLDEHVQASNVNRFE